MRRIALSLLGCLALVATGCCGSSWACMDACDPCCANTCASGWGMPRWGGLFGRNNCCPTYYDRCCGSCCDVTTSCAMPISCGASFAPSCSAPSCSAPSCAAPTFMQQSYSPGNCPSCAAPQVGATWTNNSYVASGPVMMNGPVINGAVMNGAVMNGQMISGPVFTGPAVPSEGMVYDSNWSTSQQSMPYPQQMAMPAPSQLSEPVALPPAVPGTVGPEAGLPMVQR